MRHTAQHRVRMVTGILSCLLIASQLTACATAGAVVTLQQRLTAIGIPRDTAFCMVEKLQGDLNGEDLRDLADYSVRISRAPSTASAIEQLVRIDNPRAVAAVGRAGFSCTTGFGR